MTDPTEQSTDDENDVRDFVRAAFSDHDNTIAPEPEPDLARGNVSPREGNNPTVDLTTDQQFVADLFRP